MKELEQKQNGSSSNNGVRCINFFLCIKNDSSVYKGMSTLSVIDENLEVVSR